MNIKMLEMYHKTVELLGEEIVRTNYDAHWSINYKDKYTISIMIEETDEDVVLHIDMLLENYTTGKINSYNKIYQILGYACLNGIIIEQ